MQMLSTSLLSVNQVPTVGHSGKVSPTFGHENANFSVLIDRIRHELLKE